MPYGNRTLLFKRDEKTPLIYPFICGQTLGGVNGYDSIYTSHAMSRGLVRKIQIRTFRKYNPLNHGLHFMDQGHTYYLYIIYD